MTVQEREYTVRQEGIEKGLARGLAKGREEGRAEGIVEGKAEGRAEGIKEGREKIIAQMRASGMSEEEIQSILNA